jgi:signal transduction histidine kinase
MSEEALFRAHPGRLWIALLPPLAACLCASVLAGLGVLSLPLLPFAAASVLLAFAVGVLLARSLPGGRALELRARQLQAISFVIGKAGGSPELQEVLDAITAATAEVTGVRGCSIKLLDSGAPAMSVRSVAGLHRPSTPLRTEAAESISTRSLLDGRPVQVEGADQEEFPELDPDVESLLCVPLRRAGTVIGALCVYGQKGKRLGPEVLSFLSRLGDLAALTIANAAVYDELKRLDAAKTWFLRKAAHEMVSPLSVIQSLSMTLLEGYLGEMNERQRAEIERVRARASGLSAVVGDLLDLAQVKAAAARLPAAGQPVDLAAALAEIVSFYRAAAAEKGVRLEAPAEVVPLLVRGTEEGIRSVITNLLSNAIKYTAAGGRVEALIEAADGLGELAVRDTGIGIPAAEQERIFSEFFRASNARSYTEAGTGLGLALVKAEVEACGGSVRLESVEGQGTTVRVRLPLAARGAERGGP